MAAVYRAVPGGLRERIRAGSIIGGARTLDGPSFRRFRRIEDLDRRRARLGPLVALRVRPLGGETVWIRPGTSDAGVLRDTFFDRYHVPPGGLRGVRSILDLGSNIGLTVADLAVRFPDARVLGVELDRSNAALAARNIAPWRDRAEVLHAAVWTSGGEVAYAGLRSEEWGFKVVESPAAADATVTGKAPALTMPELLDRLAPGGTVDYVKMDVEGAEATLLAEAGAWAPSVRCIKVEVHAPYDVAGCMRDLRAAGFDVTVDGRHPSCVVGARDAGLGG
jgi:FkbM family methyltransferase